MSVKPRTFTTAVLGMGIALGLLLPAAVAHAQPEPITTQEEPGAGGASDPTAEPPSEPEDGADPGADPDDGTGPATTPESTPAPSEAEESAAPETEAPESEASGDDAATDDAAEHDLSKDPANAYENKGPFEFSPFVLNATSSLLAGFKAGYIVSDTNFYNGGAMSAAQVQAFLNERVTRCTIGDPGRTAGSKWGNTHIAQKCLRNYTMNTANIGADAYCKAYQGRTGETSAQIIVKVAQACGISPKVLLVMLEKEQSLVSDSWPTVRQLDVAMGANCPDSGPNWSANCDPRYYGFQKQVHRGAWLLKYYKLNPNQYQYRAGRTSTIQYHPNPGCGTSQVRIENQATAALYIYTPYVPNAAALNAGRGKGDACSSYGNRNFYQLYKQWFGSPNSAFPDVPQGHQFFTEIEWMHSSGLTTGIKTSDGRIVYNPKGQVTREAMAAFLYRLDGATYKGPKTSPFADLKPGDKFYNEISWMYEKGLSTGIAQPSGKPVYAPKDRVSREAMAAFIYRYQKAKYTGPASSPFADMKRGDKFYNEITWMYKERLSTGISQGAGKKPIYAPKDRVSREAMAAFIYRLSH